jgi:hypothetical protein
MKREDNIKELFIEHLKKTESVRYHTIDQDVPSRNGNTNFDYLLQEENGKTLALEITQARESAFGPTNNSFDVVAKFFRNLLNDGRGLPAMTIHVPPFDYTQNKLKGILKQESQRIVTEIRRKVSASSVGESFHVEIPGNYVIDIDREHGMDLVNIKSFMSHTLSSHAIELDLVYPQVAALLSKKDKQLDYSATRNVLLMLDTRLRLMRDDNVIQSAVARFADEKSDQEIKNIDEIFICHAKNLFTTAYSRGR